MRILHICSEYPPQKVFGLGRYVSDLSRELSVQGHEVSVLTNSIGGQHQDAIQEGVSVHRVDFPPPPMPPTPGAPVAAFNLHLQQRAHQLGRNGLGNPEVVVSHDWLTALAGHHISKRFNLPHVWTVHDLVRGKRFGIVEHLEDRLADRLERWAASEADVIIANSSAIEKEVLESFGAPSERIGLVHPGIDAAAYELAQSEARLAMFRSCLATPEERLLTCTARFDLEKGIDTLINGFSLLKKRFPRVKLAIAGKGVLQPTIEEHVRKLGLEHCITICGYLEGEVLRSFYRVSDVHVCPSYYEPFGLVALEAMASGTPVVVSDTGGLRDIVPDATRGRRIPSRDPGVLAETLLALLRDDVCRKELGQAGKAHVRTHFTWSRLAEKAVRLYQRAERSERTLSV